MRQWCGGERPFIDAPSSRVEWPGAPKPTGETRAGDRHLLSRDDILSSEGWIEVTAMGSREREWIPRHPPQERRTLLARQHDRVGGPGRAEAEIVASRSCADCGMDDEPADRSGRCRFCAELAALRPAMVPEPTPRRISAGILPAAAMLILILILVLAAGIGLLLSGALR